MLSIGDMMFTLDPFGFMWVIFVTLWLATMIYSKRTAEKKILSLISDKNNICGTSAVAWLTKIDAPIEYSFDTANSNVISFDNTEFFAINSTFSAISHSKMETCAYISSYKCWCLLAIGEDAVSKLEKSKFMFKRISKTDKTMGLYVIRRLYKFCCMVEAARNRGAE